MKNFEETLPLIFAIVIAIILVWGFTMTIKKTLSMPDTGGTIDTSAQIKEQKRRIADIQRLQKENMRNQKQKIRDLQRL